MDPLKSGETKEADLSQFDFLVSLLWVRGARDSLVPACRCQSVTGLDFGGSSADVKVQSADQPSFLKPVDKEPKYRAPVGIMKKRYLKPNSQSGQRKSTADISVHPIQVGNTAMESILTMVGYMYIAIGEALKGKPDYR